LRCAPSEVVHFGGCRWFQWSRPPSGCDRLVIDRKASSQLIADLICDDNDAAGPPLDEALCRIVTAFDRVRVERQGIDPPWPRSLLQQYILNDRASGAIVSVATSSTEMEMIEFAVVDKGGVFVVYPSPTDREKWKAVTSRLAEILGCQVNTSFLTLRITVETDDLLIADERKVFEIIQSCIYRHDLGSIQGNESSYLGLTVDLWTPDTDRARKHLDHALAGIPNELTVEYEIVP
jgi:hypothetical protein